jgi:hypothetical protein
MSKRKPVKLTSRVDPVKAPPVGFAIEPIFKLDSLS